MNFKLNYPSQWFNLGDSRVRCYLKHDWYYHVILSGSEDWITRKDWWIDKACALARPIIERGEAWIN